MRDDGSGPGGVPGPGRRSSPGGEPVPGPGRQSGASDLRQATWQPLDAMPARCDHPHGRSGGTLDERARRLSHTELAVAQQLCAEGHEVRSLAERPRTGPMADLQVCGQPVEVKSWLPLVDRSGPPSSRSVYNKLASARSQAPTVILWGVDAGVTSSTARAGMAEFAANRRWGGLRTVRVIGAGFDLSWQRPLGVEVGPRPGAGHRIRAPRQRPPGRGLA